MLLRSLIILNLLFVTVSCSDKDKGSPAPTQETPESTNEEITNAPTNSSSNKSNTPPRVTRPTKPKPQPVEALDAEIAVLAQEVRNQLINDPKSEEKKSRNVQFANRILKINYSHRKSALSFETHSKQTYKFHHTSSKSGVNYYNYYENNSSRDLLLSSKTALFSASAKSIKSSNKNKQIVLIKIKDVTEDAVISVFYVIRSGKVTAIESEDIDYTKELTRTSQAFKDSLIKRPDVVGEFYGVITEADNNSSATRFTLTVSDNFVLESQPTLYSEKTDEPQLIPLVLSEKSWLKTACGLLCDSNVSHRSGHDFVYVNESLKKPVELKGLNIDLKLDAHERIKGQKNRVPLRLHVQF